MNWITTNIRLPEDLYRDLKAEAFNENKSFATVVREKLTKRTDKPSRKKFWLGVRKLAKEMARENPGLSLSQKLIEMRYEQ